MSTFKVRRISQSSSAVIKQKSQQRIIVEPDKIIFQSHQSMSKIAKIRITNLFNQMVQFSVKQPTEPCFKVKFSKNILISNQSMQMYVFYNPQFNFSSLNDQIIINSNINQGYSLTIPIYVRNADQIKRMMRVSKRKSKTKENLNIIRLQSQYRHIGQNKRKAGIILSLSKYKNGQILCHESDLIGRIKKFQEQFSRIQNFLKQKAIKSEIYRGEKPITKQENYDIICFNVTIEMMIKQIMKQKIIKRYKSQKSKNGPSVRIMDNIRLQWNKNRNQPKITYKKGLQKLLRQVRNFVIYHRFKKMNKILSIYRNLREQQNIEQPQTKIVNKKLGISVSEFSQSESQIWNFDQDRQYHMQIQQKKKHDYYCRKINKIIGNKKQKNLGADFTQFTLNPRILPMDYQAPQSKKNQTFQIKSRIGFDNWVTLEQSTPYNHQLIKYTKTQRIFQWECHPNYQFNSKSLTKKYSNNENFLVKKASQRKENIEQQKDLNENALKQLMMRDQKHLQLQFLQIRRQKYSNFRLYQKTPNESDFLNNYQFTFGQSQALKPLKLNSHGIKSIRQQDYIFYSPPPYQDISSLLLDKKAQNSLIYNIRKDDIIDFDDPSDLTKRKIQYIQKAQSLDLKIANLEDYFKQIMNFSINNQSLQQGSQKRGQNFEIIENISKIKEKNINIGEKRIKSYNQYGRNTNNLINF